MRHVDRIARRVEALEHGRNLSDADRLRARRLFWIAAATLPLDSTGDWKRECLRRADRGDPMAAPFGIARTA